MATQKITVAVEITKKVQSALEVLESDLLTLKEASEILGLSTARVTSLVKDTEGMEQIKIKGGSKFFAANQIADLAKQREAVVAARAAADAEKAEAAQQRLIEQTKKQEEALAKAKEQLAKAKAKLEKTSTEAKIATQTKPAPKKGKAKEATAAEDAPDLTELIG